MLWLAGSGLVTFVVLAGLTGCPGHLTSDFPAALPDGDSAGTGGSGNGGAPGTGGMAGPPCDAPTVVFQGSCATTGGCHTSADFLPLAGPDIDKRLIGKKPILSPLCADMNLVEPTAPARGVMFELLTGDTCGPQMPLAPNPPLSPDEIACVTSWINSKL